MNIKVLAVGSIKERYLKEGIQEYVKRLGPYARMEIIEVPDEKAPEQASAAEEEQIKAREAAKLQKHIKPGSLVVALAIEGKSFSSEELSRQLQQWALKGQSEVAFVIGGSLGLHRDILAQADLKLSFSRMTFPHQLMRLVLVEQLYRCFKIWRGEPYHK
ncbi:MAG: 23S rRNA (pseudouridine(1915)-N(3))-methyltransferase RlmH [Clostridia bacterium]|nr:23S rRNA (pseudouridine(1915)-N(3))-methyltransferase RlmH [Clostridia bacterium]